MKYGSRGGVLATRRGLGRVTRCAHGCLHLSIGDVTVKLAENAFRELAAMLEEGRRKLELELAPETEVAEHTH